MLVAEEPRQQGILCCWGWGEAVEKDVPAVEIDQAYEKQEAVYLHRMGENQILQAISVEKRQSRKG